MQLSAPKASLADSNTTASPPNEPRKRAEGLSGWLPHLQREISTVHADIPIIACCFVSGLCDSSAYNAWSCFVSMQTALGVSQQPPSRPYGWLKSLTSIVFFLSGCFIFAQTQRIGALTRGTLTLSFLLQSACILAAAALVQADVVSSPHGRVESVGRSSFLEIIPLALLALQSGGQIVTSRLLNFSEIPTTVLTSVYCDLASDHALLAPFRANIKRNRRAASVVCFLAGGIAGGWLSMSSASMATALWIAGLVKVGIAVGWAVWRAKEEGLGCEV